MQMQYFNGMSLIICLGGLILSFVAIEIMDGAVISLTSIFVPVEFLAYNGLMNVSFLHVFVGTLGKSLGCIAIYVPCVLNIYQSVKSENDLMNARRLAVEIQIALLGTALLLIFFVYQRLGQKLFHRYDSLKRQSRDEF